MMPDKHLLTDIIATLEAWQEEGQDCILSFSYKAIAAEIIAKVLKHKKDRPELEEEALFLLRKYNLPAASVTEETQVDKSRRFFLKELLLLYPDEEAIKREERERMQPFLEDSIEILTNAQGEWASVTETYAPEWTHRLKEVCSLIQQALKGKR